ncbi:MAG TPA: aldo/keto reductase [Pirellulales bacterium]|jgi:aryl-alcohol dehydrogenase-like predicted oxidoreductase
MRYRSLGRSGLKISVIGLGNWNTLGVSVCESEAIEILSAAHEAGINFLDTADTYGKGAGETILGDFLHQRNRDAFVVATKLYFPISSDPNDRGLSRKHIFCSVHRSLKHLRTEYIDLLQCHRFDEQTPLEETIMAMDDLVRQGKILHWGASRFSGEQLVRCRDLATALRAHGPISNQFTYNLLERRVEQATLPACQALGIDVIGYSPLAQGVLTGKYLAGACPENSRAAVPLTRQDMWQHQLKNEHVVRRFQGVAERHGLELTAMAVAWCLRSSGVPAILIGASTPAQVLRNVQAADIELNSETLADIEAVLIGPQEYESFSHSSQLAIDMASQGSIARCN